jgi:hypothetical protein
VDGERLLDDREDLLDAAPGQRRDVDPQRPGEELVEALEVEVELLARLLVEQVPLVDRHHRRPPQLPDRTGDREIAGGHPLRRVEHQDRHRGRAGSAAAPSSPPAPRGRRRPWLRRRMPAVSISR